MFGTSFEWRGELTRFESMGLSAYLGGTEAEWRETSARAPVWPRIDGWSQRHLTGWGEAHSIKFVTRKKV